jgi:hypothetical protein
VKRGAQSKSPLQRDWNEKAGPSITGSILCKMLPKIYALKGAKGGTSHVKQ